MYSIPMSLLCTNKIRYWNFKLWITNLFVPGYHNFPNSLFQAPTPPSRARSAPFPDPASAGTTGTDTTGSAQSRANRRLLAVAAQLRRLWWPRSLWRSCPRRRRRTGRRRLNIRFRGRFSTIQCRIEGSRYAWYFSYIKVMLYHVVKEKLSEV